MTRITLTETEKLFINAPVLGFASNEKSMKQVLL